MREFATKLLPAAILAEVCCAAAMAADSSTVGQWTNKYPFDKIVGGKSLWDQPGVRAAMRAAMGKRFFALSQKEMHGPEGPVASDGKGYFAAWSCKAHNCSDTQMTVFFDSASGSAQVCWRSSSTFGGKVQDLWLADVKARRLPANACEFDETDPFASLKKFGGGARVTLPARAERSFQRRKGSIPDSPAGKRRWPRDCVPSPRRTATGEAPGRP